MNCRDFVHTLAPGAALFMALGLLIAPALRAQAAPTFEVATIKPSPASDRRFRIENGRISIGYQSLQELILYAYDRVYYDLFIPRELDWATASGLRFDVEAQGPPTATNADVRLMLRALLADRFGLKIREEPREMPVFALFVARANGKLGKGMVEVTGQPCEKPQNPQPNQPRCGNRWQPHLNVISFTVSIKAGTMAQFTTTLSSRTDFFLGRRVIDKTNLAGEYNLDFEFTVELPDLYKAPQANPDDGPLLQNALPEQLGLKLEATKAIYPVLVVESATKPGEN